MMIGAQNELSVASKFYRHKIQLPELFESFS